MDGSRATFLLGIRGGDERRAGGRTGEESYGMSHFAILGNTGVQHGSKTEGQESATQDVKCI